jgi:dipeptidyl aminopeptidase/acylaminoacyl peptidase
VVDWLPDDPRRVIVQSVGFGVEGELSKAWTMDVNTGRLSDLAMSPIANGRFVADRDHELEFIVGVNPENVVELYQRNAEKRWELIANDDDDERWVQPIAAWNSAGRWLVSDRGPSGTWGLSIWDPETWQKDDLFHHPEADVGVLYFDNDFRLWAVDYDLHFPEFFYPDESHPFVALHRRLRERFGNSVNVQIIDETDDMSRVIVVVSGPQFPGEFLLTDTQTGEFLLRMPFYPDLPTASLAPMDPIELTVRDSQLIRGYLTLPGDAREEMLPMVVLPHGGPHGVYDTWSYDFESQLLASRGYAVLQVNFRGSGGRGKAFLEAGHGEWGGTMQDDLTDATRWAIAEGIADPDRICIYGTSFGAYAALTGAFREPELYRCAIGMSGVYDLGLMFERGDIADAERGLSYLREVLGEDMSQLDSRSPVANAAAIRANVMLIHGRQDQRAPFEHAVRMREALADVGKDVVWLTETGESHGIMSDGNRVAVYEQILEFLGQSIGP